MYDVSWGDGWNNLSMSVGLTRYSPDSVWTWDRMTYSQFLNIATKPLVGHDDTIIASFDIPCNLWLVVASLLFAGICFILHQMVTFFEDAWWCLTDTSRENCSGSSLNLQLIISFANLLFRSSSFDLIVCFFDWWLFGSKSSWRFNSFIVVYRLVMYPTKVLMYCTNVLLAHLTKVRR